MGRGLRAAAGQTADDLERSLPALEAAWKALPEAIEQAHASFDAVQAGGVDDPGKLADLERDLRRAADLMSRGGAALQRMEAAIRRVRRAKMRERGV